MLCDTLSSKNGRTLSEISLTQFNSHNFLMKKLITCTLLALLTCFFTDLSAQDDCECTNCPVTITDNDTFQGFLDVNVSGPNNLAACPLQQVCFTINHTWIGDLAVTLTSPGGLNYMVMADNSNASGGCGTNADNIDVCVTIGTGNPLTNNSAYACNGGNPCLVGNWTVPCGGVTDPITGASQAPGCDLNAFNQNGQPANGTWILTINDVCGADVGQLTNWSLDFACGINSCVDCDAEGGTLNQQDVEGCSGSPALNLNITPTYSGGNSAPSPASDYDYTFLVSQGGVLTPFSPLDGPNVGSLPPGEYEICGLSYENSSTPNLAMYYGQPVSVLASDLEGDAAPFCGDVSDDCFDAVVGLPNPPIVRDTFGCATETLILPDGSSCNPGICEYSVDIGTGCPQDYSYIFVPFEQTPTQEVNEAACEGGCVEFEGEIYCDPQQLITLTDENGCDYFVTLFIDFVPVNAEVAEPDDLTCTVTTVTLDGSASTGDSFEWRDENGLLLGTDNTLDVTQPGCYTLTAFNTTVNPPCTDEETVCVTQSGDGAPTQPSPTGSNPVCAPGAGSYSVVSEPGITYSWTVSGNGTIAGGQGTNQISVNWTSAGTADVCVTAANDCGISAPGCFSVTVEAGPEDPVISGDNPVCPNGTGSYSVPADPNINNYTWAVPAGAAVTAGQGTNSITVSFGTFGGDVCVTIDNDCGAAETCFPVTLGTLPAAPTVSGPDEVCPGETVTYTTPNDAAVTNYNWTVPACATIDAGQGTNSITVTWDAACTAAGNVCVEVSNDCGGANSDCSPVSIGSNVATPVVTGANTVCISDTETYSVTPVAEATNYIWTITGGTIDSGNGTNSVNVTWNPSGPGEICASVVTDCGTSDPDCLSVTVNDAPAVPALGGQSPICVGQTGTYNITSPLIGDETFAWTVAGGGTITGGETASEVIIDWTTEGTYDVCLTLTNTCGDAQNCFTVTVNPAVAPPTIGGPVSVCQNSTEDYFVTDPVAGETYNWTIPADATLINGSTSDMISIDWGTSSGGDVCVTATGTCGTTAPVCITVSTDGVPQLGAVAGADIACVGTTENYTVGALSTATGYTWTTDCGSITSGQGTTDVSLDIAAGCTEINLCVTATTDCGDTPPSCSVITVNDVPPVTTQIDGANTTCLGTTETYCADAVAGADSYQWTITGGTIVGGLNTDCVDVEWEAEGTGAVCVAAVNTCGTGAELCLDVTVDNTTAMPEIVTTDAVCQCDETTATIDAADAVTVTWTVPTGATVTAGQGTDNITIDWCDAVTGEVCVELTYACGSAGDCQTVTVSPVPTADAGADDAICGLSYPLNAAPSVAGSTGMWTYAGAETADFLDVNDPNTTVTVSTFGAYEFIWTEDNNGCGDTDAVTITFNDAPTADGTIQETCNGTNTAYTVTFDITGGAEPYTVNGLAGTVTGSTFVSEEIVSGGNYTFSVTDADGCVSEEYNGTLTCDCDTNPGTMSTDQLEACTDETVQAVHNGDAVLDDDDVFQYILTDGDPVNGAVYDLNTTGEFGLVPPMQPEVTYFIVYAVGDPDAAGNVDLDAPCADYAAGQPVVFHAYPLPDAGADDEVCGLTYELAATPDVAGGGWTSADAGVIFDNAAAPNTLVTVPDFGTFTFVWTEDNFGCTGGDDTEITFNAGPELAAPQTEVCDLATAEYTVSFTVIGGEAPYFVDGTMIAGADFTSAPIGSNVPYSFTVTDNNGCGPLTIEGVRNCDCSTDAGTMGQTLQEACITGTVSGLPNGDEFNDGDDVIQYILHDGNGTLPGTIFETSDTPEFAFNPPLEAGVIYYISLIIGNDAGDGSVDFGDPCFQTAVGTPVVFNPLPDGTISGDTAICEGGSAEISFALTGTPPFTVVFDGNTLTDQPAAFTQTVTPATTASYSLTMITDADGCTAEVSSTVIIVVNTPPSADVIPAVTICNSDDNGNVTVLDFSALITGGDATGMWTDTDGSGAAGDFTALDFTGVPAGDYTFTYTTAAADAPCENVSYTVTVTVEDCLCPSVATVAPDPLCNDAGTLDLTSLQLTVEAGTWTLIEQPAGETAALSGTVFDVQGLTAGDYIFEFTLDVMPPPGCPTSSQQTLTVSAAADAGTPNGAIDFCEGTGTTVNLEELLSDADAGGVWTEVSGSPSAGGFNAGAGTFNPNGEAAGTYTFRYTVAAVPPCTDAFSEVSIEIRSTPTAEAGEDAEITCEEEEAVLGGTAQSGIFYEWEAADGGVLNEDEINDANPTVFTAGTYMLTVTNQATGCSDTDVVTVTEDTDLPTANFSISNISCFGDSDGIITIDSVTGGQPPYVYSLDGENFGTSTFFPNLSAGSYTISVQDANGCVNTVTFNFPEPEELTVELFAVLEDNNTITFGDSVTLTMAYSPNMPFDSLDNVQWTPAEVLNCDTCQTVTATPLETTNFTLTIQEGDCIATDNLNLVVRREPQIYVPTAFSPDGDGINDIFYIYAGDQVDRINAFLVFNRWGEVVHEFYQIPANDPSFGWNGRWRGQPMNSAVFAWYAEVLLIDGRTEIIEGDVTLMR